MSETQTKLESALSIVRDRLDDFSEDEVREELEELLEYDVPADQAAQTVVRNHSDTGGGESGGEKTISEIAAGDRSLSLDARVIDRRDRTIEVEGEPREIVSGTLADETGVISFTAWNEFPFDEGDAVRVENAYSKEWNDRPELQMGDYTDLVELEDTDLPSAESLAEAKEVSIADASSVYKARIEATIIDVMDRSGLIMRCPECNRVTEGGKCSEHGDVEPDPDLRIKAVLDDGVAPIQATFDRETTEKLTGVTLEQAEDMARDAMDREVVQTEMEEVVGETIVATGRVLGDNFLVDDVEEPTGDPHDDAKELMEVLQ